MTASSGLLLLFAGVLLAGCESLAYYGQSINGQLDLMQRARPIDQLLTEPGLAPRTARQLRLVQQLRRFASERLALPDNGSYASYADVERSALVWSVVATPAYEVTPKRWCYPLVGCLAYRGYFDRTEAKAEASRLRRQGMDVAVLPVPAYSTLGWFDDPLPSTVIHWPEAELAGLLFHELAHQQIYIADDTAFNEAYASSVAEQGVRLWLAERSALVKDWQLRRVRSRQVSRLLLSAREKLTAAFDDAVDDEGRASRKAAIYAELAADYRRLSRGWATPRPYGHWFAAAGDETINNAHLAQVATYDHWLPAFNRLWQESAGDPAAFHQAVAALGKLPRAQRHRRLEQLLTEAASE